MSQFLHLRLGRFFAAVAGQKTDTVGEGQPWRRALGQAQSMATTLRMTARLDELAHRSCRAIEWRSATEAWLDLGTGRGESSPWAIADQLRAATVALLPLEVACGVAASKLAARAASALAAPSGLVVVLPGYESSILSMASRTTALFGDPHGDTLDAAPFRPSLVPRAIVRGVDIDRAADSGLQTHDANDASCGYDTMVEALVREARHGLAELNLIAASVRVQFANANEVRDTFATLPDATSGEDTLIDAALPLGRRVLAGTSGSGHLCVSLGQLTSADNQASLFGWRYDRVSPPRPRRFA